MTSHLVLETADSLMYSYETIALKHQKNYGNKNNYQTTFPLLILNASIIEGILRFWLSNSIKSTINEIIDQGKKLGKTQKEKAEQLLENYLIEVEGNGGFDKIKGQYNFYFNISLDTKTINFDPEPINALFTLRNVLAHGTALVAPKTPAGSPNRAFYVDRWQSRLQSATNLVKGQTSAPDIFQALDCHNIPAYFFNQSKLFLAEVADSLPKGTKIGIAYPALRDLKFGYRLRT